MPADLTPAAEAFLDKWTGGRYRCYSYTGMVEDMAALLAAVRAEEQELCARIADNVAEVSPDWHATAAVQRTANSIRHGRVVPYDYGPPGEPSAWVRARHCEGTIEPSEG